MKKVLMYQCELCKEIYDNSDEALNCENRGKETPIASVGQIVKYECKVGGGFDSFYVDLKLSSIEDLGHIILYQFEEFDSDNNEWYESTIEPGIYGNREFQELCIIE